MDKKYAEIFKNILIVTIVYIFIYIGIVTLVNKIDLIKDQFKAICIEDEQTCYVTESSHDYETYEFTWY